MRTPGMTFVENVRADTYQWATEHNCIDAFTTAFAAISTAEVEQVAAGFARAFDADRRPARQEDGRVGSWRGGGG
jgi:hypothetical protein